ncbi:MAG: hypothetical protein IH899_07510 [Planctomycetes bacterium]|nr:hypothetical protein [Planctomycetota bacterium]
MTPLEFAQQLFGYDPETTPQRELEHATRSFREAEMWHESNTETLAGLDDNAVYEWRYDGEAQIHRATKREIVKRTPKQIRLAPKHPYERQTYLPRQPLESGELVRRGTGWWLPDYVFGWVIRPKVKEQLTVSSHWLEDSRANLQRVELAIINDELLITPDQRRMIDLIMGLVAKSKQPDTPQINWQQEGF